MPSDSDRQLREWVTDLFGAINGFGGRPSAGQLAQIPVLGERLGEARSQFEKINSEVSAINRELQKRSLAPIQSPAREAWEKEQAS
jgi:hypothetical protein